MPPKKPKLSAAEKKLRNEEAKRQLKVDQLDREIKYGNLTLLRHERNWKKLLLDIATPVARSELEYAWHVFERAIDAKDFTISLLMDELKDGEEQYAKNLRHHCEHTDKLIASFREQLDELKLDNDRAVLEQKQQLEDEIETMKNSHKLGEDYLIMMLYGLEATRKEQEQVNRCLYSSKLEEDAGKDEETIQKMQYHANKSYAILWCSVQDFICDYSKSSAQRRKQYEILNTQDEQVSDLLKSQLGTIVKMTNVIKRLRQKLMNMQNTQGKNVRDLLHERKFLADKFWDLKSQLEHEMTKDDEKLTTLTSESNKSMKHLALIEKKGEHILQLATCCRKFETLEEKILPFPVAGRTSDEVVNDDLDLFWRRVGQADALRHSLCEEKSFLLKENDEMLQKIHEYCECLDCEAYPSPENRRRSVVNRIDGSEEAKKYAKQGVLLGISCEAKPDE